MTHNTRSSSKKAAASVNRVALGDDASNGPSFSENSNQSSSAVSSTPRRRVTSAASAASSASSSQAPATPSVAASKTVSSETVANHTNTNKLSSSATSHALLIATVCLSPIVYAFTQLLQHQPAYFDKLLVAGAIALFALVATWVLIPPISALNLAADLCGIDINKRGLRDAEAEKTPIKVPESAGIVPGTIFIICLTLCQLIYAGSEKQKAEFTSALSTITFIVFLGFADDVLNLRWRYKLILPPIASLSLVLAYAGVTEIVVPTPLRPWLGNRMELGPLYRLYMLLLTTFCSNAINIHAGLNGLEVGQSIVIGCAVLLHNLIEIGAFGASSWSAIFGAKTMTIANSETLQNAHLFSAIVVLLFLAVSLALWSYNWYPSTVFVGDTFTYFAGVTFAVCGILGHFSKTLLLFFIPQILNFLYSLPQLIGIIPCPRHRLPKVNTATGKLEGIPSNLNLINLALLLLGPQTEKALCTIMLVFQILCCAAGFFVRYYVSSLLY